MKKPLAALALLAVAATVHAAPAVPNWNKGTPIDITVTNDRFTPDRITLKRGGQYILRFHNRSDRRHNFSAPQFFDIARVSPRDGRLVSDDKVDLKAGQSATLHIVAPTTPNAVFSFRSTNLLDATENLKGEIRVR